MTTVTITNRTGPCRCGCKGTDPWHATTYRRTIRAIRAGDESRDAARARGRLRAEQSTAHGIALELRRTSCTRIVETGTARLPGRSAAAVVHREWFSPSLDRWLDLGWAVDHTETSWD